ncbi:MAG TPA: hypothetical protein VK989_17995 [Polyangia bacterium]|jgi:hypothetical protein|nr:hypothetical protein [Polyangia bacterium]
MKAPRAARKLALAFFFVSLVSLASACHKKEAPPPEQERPRSFGPRTVWLAFRGATPQAVAKALDLREVAPIAWTGGLVGAYAGRVFVTPPVDGWVLATSTRFPDTGGGEHPDGATPLLARLSRQFDEVQYFGTHEDIGWVAWARYANGAATRKFAYLGGHGVILWNEGDPSPEERALNLDFSVKALRDGGLPEEANVFALAAKWSVDPSKLGERLDAGSGLGGVLPPP